MEPLRFQCLLPPLAPAPPSSSSAATPHKLDQLHTDSRCRSAIAHVFFNRRPLDLIRRGTSSLLTTGGTLVLTGVVATPPGVEERSFWHPHRAPGDKNGRCRLQQMQDKDKKKKKGDHKQQQKLRLAREVGDTEHKGSPERTPEKKRRPAPCPLTGQQVLLNGDKAAELTALERVEIQQYDEVTFVSTRTVKRSRRNGTIQNEMPVHGDEEDVVKQAEKPDETWFTESCNDSYDDEHGDYLVLMGDHLAFRYEVLSALGQGSFGQVVYCLDHRTCKHVAVKIIRNRREYRDQALTEVQLLTQLQCAAAACDENPHVVRFEEYFEFRDHVCIVFEVLGTNLYEFLKMRCFRGVSMSSVCTVGKQLAQALTFLKQQQVVHCDLKPENVLLDASTDVSTVDNVTLIDFGSSCLEGASMFTYTQSRFYRSPEVLLGHTCSGAIDMWSFACILAELHTGHPIFAGENEGEQFACILEVLGVPPNGMVHKCKRRLNFFDEVVNSADVKAVDYFPKRFVNSHGCRRMPGSRSLASVVMTDDSDFLAFLAKCFVWEPSQRLTPEQVLKEPWIRHQQEYEL